MFLPHSQTHVSKNKTSHTPSSNAQNNNQANNKQTNSNDDYIAFIRNNHNMIEKHFMNDFQHPYKNSLLKSHAMTDTNDTKGNRKLSNSQVPNQHHYNSLFTLEQAPVDTNNKHSGSLKLHHSTNIEKLSRKHQIINSLNFTKPSVTNSITNHPVAPAYRYSNTNNASTTKAPFTKEEILSLIQEKNKEISNQLSRQRNNFSEIVYKTKHHSQSNMVKVPNGGQSRDKNRPSIDREQVPSRELKNMQRIKKEEYALTQSEPQESNENNRQRTHRVMRENVNTQKHEVSKSSQKFQRYNHNQNPKAKYNIQFYSEPQIPPQKPQNITSNHSNTFVLPIIKNRSHSYTNNEHPDVKLSENPSLLSQYDIMNKIQSKPNKYPIVLTSGNGQKSKEPSNLSASINQLRKQFQQNSDAIKMYKKVQKNNIALKVRQINQKNLKSYYEYENAIIKNAQYIMIEEEYKKNAMTMKDLKAKDSSKSKAKIFSTDEQDYFGSQVEETEEEIPQKIQGHQSKEGPIIQKHRMSPQEMFIKDIIREKIKDQPMSKSLSPLKKSMRYLPSPAELEEELTGRKDFNNDEENNYQNEDSQPLSDRNSVVISPSKLKKNQPKNQSLSIIPAVTKAQSTVYDLKVRAYREFAFKILFTHKKYYPLIIREMPSTFMRPEEKLKFFVGKGNNSLLIKSLMKRRFWWTLEQDPKKANFVWTQLKINSLYEYQKKSQVRQLYYKTEDILGDSSPQVTKKTKKKNLNKEEQLKEKKTFIFKAPLPEDDDMKVFTEYDKKVFNRFSNTLNEMQNPEKLDNFEKRIAYFPQNFLDPIMLEEQTVDNCQTNASQQLGPYSKNPQISYLKTIRMHNHFQFNHFIGNKKALFYNLRYYYQLINKDVYDIIPLTFHIRNGVKDPQYAKFLKYYKAIQKKSKGQSKAQKQKHDDTQPKAKKQKNIWIIKPGENSNRGNGIQVFDQLYELNNILKKKDANKDKNNQPHTYIVQKYIEKPLLYKNRKFDIRHYFVLTRMWGKMKAYFFGQGYIRTASYEFDLANVGDTEIHLTNDAIQKHCDSYGKYQEGNKLSYVEFQRYLDSVAKEEQTKAYNNSKKSEPHEKKAISFANDIYPQMRSIAIQAIRACYLQMDPNKTQHNFEVFGMDFMIDKDYKVWLIEINTNPCLELSSKLLERVIPTMVEQSLRLTLDVIFPPPYHYPNTMKHMMPDYSLEKLKCELIFDEDRDGKQLEEMLNKQLEIDKKEGRKSIREMLLGEIDQEDETYENDGKQINLGEKGGVQVE